MARPDRTQPAGPAAGTAPAADLAQLAERVDALTRLVLAVHLPRNARFGDVRAFCLRAGLPLADADKVAAVLTGTEL